MQPKLPQKQTLMKRQDTHDLPVFTGYQQYPSHYKSPCPQCLTSTSWWQESHPSYITVWREVPKIYKLTSLTEVTSRILLWGRLQLQGLPFLAGVRRCPTLQCSTLWKNKRSLGLAGKKQDKLSIKRQTAIWNLPARWGCVCAIAFGLSLVMKGWITTHSTLSVIKAIKTKPQWASLLPCKSTMDSLTREGHYLFSHSNFTHVRNVVHIGN